MRVMVRRDRQTVHVTFGEKPPETIQHDDGRTYRPTWLDVTTERDRRLGEQVFEIAAMGEPIEDDDDFDNELN
jgi:hypothetical protein